MWLLCSLWKVCSPCCGPHGGLAGSGPQAHPSGVSQRGHLSCPSDLPSWQGTFVSLLRGRQLLQGRPAEQCYFSSHFVGPRSSALPPPVGLPRAPAWRVKDTTPSPHPQTLTELSPGEPLMMRVFSDCFTLQGWFPCDCLSMHF